MNQTAGVSNSVRCPSGKGPKRKRLSLAGVRPASQCAANSEGKLSPARNYCNPGNARYSERRKYTSTWGCDVQERGEAPGEGS
ncbi:unnamed protein product [Eretmochelys imbricata]